MADHYFHREEAVSRCDPGLCHRVRGLGEATLKATGWNRIQGFGFTCLLAVATLGTSPSCLHAQTRSEVANLAQRAVENVAKFHPDQILVAPLEGCLLNPQICDGFDAALRSDLRDALPATHLIGKGEVRPYLKTYGLLTTDLYNPEVLQTLGAVAGVRLLVAEDLRWKKQADELDVKIFDIHKRVKLKESVMDVARPDQISGDEPLILKDPETGTSLVVPRKLESPPRYSPSCRSCPNPSYSKEARAKRLQGTVVLMATVNEKGTADHIVVIKALDDSLNQRSVEAVSNWTFNPALGPDGMPFAVRVPVEVTYSLQ